MNTAAHMDRLHFQISIMILFMIGMDLITTFVGISFFGGQEINPVINSLQNWWIVTGWKLGSGIVVVVAARTIHTFYPALAAFQGIFFCGYLGLFVNNISWW
jgi:hypothetical protein